MIQDILFPVDFSPSCAAMGGFVKRAAEMFGAKVTLLHVFDLSSQSGFELYSRPPSEITEDHRSIAGDKLNKFLPVDFPAAESSRLLLSGDAAACITQCARDGRFDLIVMPTHSGQLRRMFLGSTTAKVIGEVPCPVLTTRHAETISPRPLEHRVWACALGLDEDSERVLRRASEAARAAGARLLLIHVLDSALRQPPAGFGQHPAELEARKRLDVLQKAAGCSADVSVVIGGVEEVLLAAVREVAADVLVIGRNPRAVLGGHINGFSYVLTRDALCPVLSV